ncbi:MAG: inositol monophosphatase family protein [Propionibacteriaceae bacterium]|nr:inositol monophosphatase family protein [Propionibacteriaceae bacterium]
MTSAATLSDVDVAVLAATAGAQTAMSFFGRTVERYAKGDNDFTTAADIAAERAARDVLAKMTPGDAVTGEELSSTGNGRRNWLIDPICGTFNFASGVPLFAVNVALEIDDMTSAAAVAEPSSGIIYASDGLTTRRQHNGTSELAHPSADSLLVDINVAYDYPASANAIRLLSDATFGQRFAPRLFATTLALAWVAAGKASAYLCGGDPHGSVHFAAGVMLCQASGAIVTDLDGEPLRVGKAGFIAASDSETQAAILRRLHEVS